MRCGAGLDTPRPAAPSLTPPRPGCTKRNLHCAVRGRRGHRRSRHVVIDGAEPARRRLQRPCHRGDLETRRPGEGVAVGLFLSFRGACSAREPGIHKPGGYCCSEAPDQRHIFDARHPLGALKTLALSLRLRHPCGNEGGGNVAYLHCISEFLGTLSMRRHSASTANGQRSARSYNRKYDAGKVSEMANAGYRITKDTPYELAFDKPVQNLAMAVLLGSRYDAQPNARVTYTFAQIGNDTRVIGDVAVITNPGSAFERRTELNNGVDAYDLQTGLQRLRAAMDPNSALSKARKNKIELGLGVITAERAKVAGMSGPKRGLYVTIVKPNSVASAAGIKKGDVLIRFNSVTLTNDTDLERAEAAVRPGSTAKVAIWRSDNTESVVTVRFPRTQRTAQKS